MSIGIDFGNEVTIHDAVSAYAEVARPSGNGKKIAGKKLEQINPGDKRVRFKVNPKLKGGKVRLQVVLSDRADISVKTVEKMRVQEIK